MGQGVIPAFDRRVLTKPHRCPDFFCDPRNIRSLPGLKPFGEVSGADVAADQGRIQEVSQAERERNRAEGRCD